MKMTKKNRSIKPWQSNYPLLDWNTLLKSLLRSPWIGTRCFSRVLFFFICLIDFDNGSFFDLVHLVLECWLVLFPAPDLVLTSFEFVFRCFFSSSLVSS